MLNEITHVNINIDNNRKERINMCIAIDEMMKDSRLEGKEEGIEEGIEIGGIKKLFELVNENIITISQAAANAKLSEEQFNIEMVKAGY